MSLDYQLSCWSILRPEGLKLFFFKDLGPMTNMCDSERACDAVAGGLWSYKITL